MLEEIKGNKILILITLVGWVAIVIGASFSYGIDTEMSKSLRFDNISQKTIVIGHVADEDIHMPMGEKIKIFVPRTELEKELESQSEKMDLIIQMIRDK